MLYNVFKDPDILYNLGQSLIKNADSKDIIQLIVSHKFSDSSLLYLKDCVPECETYTICQQFKNAKEKKSIYHIIGFYPIEKILPYIFKNNIETIYMSDLIRMVINNRFSQYLPYIIKILNNITLTGKYNEHTENIIKQGIRAIGFFGNTQHIYTPIQYIDNKNLTFKNYYEISSISIETLCKISSKYNYKMSDYQTIISKLFDNRKSYPPKYISQLLKSIIILGGNIIPYEYKGLSFCGSTADLNINDIFNLFTFPPNINIIVKSITQYIHTNYSYQIANDIYLQVGL